MRTIVSAAMGESESYESKQEKRTWIRECNRIGERARVTRGKEREKERNEEGRKRMLRVRERERERERKLWGKNA